MEYKEMFLKAETRRLELELEIAGAARENIQQFKEIIETNIEHKNINKRDPDVEEKFILNKSDFENNYEINMIGGISE